MPAWTGKRAWRALLGVLLLAAAAPARAEGSAEEQKQLSDCKANIQSIVVSLERWSAEHDMLYPVKLSLLVPDYFDEIPVCPAHPERAYGYRRTDAGYISVKCPGGHASVGSPKGYPAYTSTTGLTTQPATP